MRKLVLFCIVSVALAMIGCSSIQQVEETSNYAEITKTVLPDSSAIYIINWKGHTYIYDRYRRPNLIEIR